MIGGMEQNATVDTQKARGVLLVGEVAERLRCTPRTVQELHRRGKLCAVPHIKPLRWLESRVQAFLEGGE